MLLLHNIFFFQQVPRCYTTNNIFKETKVKTFGLLYDIYRMDNSVSDNLSTVLWMVRKIYFSKSFSIISNVIEYLMLFTFAYPHKRYDSKKRFSSEMFNCHYNQNKGYVVFSAMGSFFIPMTVMLYVYSKIFYVLMSRQHRMSKTEVIFYFILLYFTL